jgi:small subunit ribosomal protein S16
VCISYVYNERKVTELAAKIKLKRMGKKKAPFYRVIIQDESSPRRGRYIDWIGIYNPISTDSKLEINKEKALEWISKGAKPTDKVRILLGRAGILPAVSFEGKVRRQPKAKESAEKPTEAAAAPAAEVQK